MNSPSFARSFYILETIGQVNLRTIMEKPRLDDLLLNVLKHLFYVDFQIPYSTHVYGSMKMIMCGVLGESHEISK